LTNEEWDGYPNVDFSVSAYFTKMFAKILLEKKMPPDVDVLNLVVPESATKDTPWEVTKLARIRYFNPFVERKEDSAKINSHPLATSEIPPDSDMHTVRIDKKIAVIPLSLDLTSRIELKSLEQMLRN
jgi:5'-nucleotidase